MPQFEDFREFDYNGSIGVIIGPAISTSPELSIQAGHRFRLTSTPEEDEVAAYVMVPFVEGYGRMQSKSPEELRGDLREFLLNLERSSSAEHLSRGRWSAVVSLTPDCIVDDLMRVQMERLPTSREVVVVGDTRALPPKRCFPIYRLLGNPRSTDLQSRVSISKTEHDIRAHQWAGMMQTLPDHVMNKPILVAGFSGYEKLFSRFINAIVALGPAHPRTFLLLRQDGLHRSGHLDELESYGILFKVLEGDSSLVVRHLADRSSQPAQGTLNLLIDDEPLLAKLSSLCAKCSRSIAIVIPVKAPAHALRKRLVQLTDALFRPTALDFEPYYHKLHLPRTASREIVSEVTSLKPGSQNRLNVISIVGDAGTGKSSVLKEVCAELSLAGIYCFWLSPSALQLNQSDLSAIVSELNELASEHEELSKVAFVLDDALERFPLHELCRELEKLSLGTTLVLSFRSSDLISDAGISYPLQRAIDSEYQIPIELDESELSQLPSFLTRVGIAKNEDNASKQIAALDTRNAQDILCVLWYLIPSTRRSLSDSLQDQYLSLGDVNRVIRTMAEEAERLSKAAKKVWEICAVSSSLQLGVPLEVLVRAMEISWDEWVEMCQDGTPLWGLVYPEEGPAEGEALYWTRNEVVTTVLIRLINGGHGHAGEVPILDKVIQACSIGTDVYRQFLFEIFVRRRKILGDRFTLEQGRNLFQALFSALPYEDKAFQHQYGLWLKDKGAELPDAIRELKRALVTQDSPGASASERDEHIRTSIAAAVVLQAKRSERSLDSALEEVQENLRYARTTSYLDAHASHVFGNLLLELAQMHAAEGDKKSQLAAVADGLAVIERTFQLGGSASGWAAFSSGDQGMLAGLQERLVATFENEIELEEIAKSLVMQHKSQAGFVVLGRKRLVAASKLGKGSEFNRVRESLSKWQEFIAEAGLKLSSRFVALRVDLLIRWQVQRDGCKVDWDQIVEDLQTLLHDPLFSQDSVKTFYLAVSLFQLGRHEEANAMFSQLRAVQMMRRTKGSARCFYQGNTGFPRKVPGTAKRSHGRWYFESVELHQDVPLRETNDGYINGLSLSCYVGFSFFGPFAIKRRPNPDEFELPT